MSIYAFTDLHGRYDLWEKIKEFLKDGDTAYCLGDSIDRGARGGALLNDMIKDERVTILRGNHEDMFLKALPYLIDGQFSSFEVEVFFLNGGRSTWNYFKKWPIESLIWLQKQLIEMPTLASFTNKNEDEILLSHAGYSPWSGKRDYLWDRDHIEDGWRDYKFLTKQYVVHGHTPVLANKTLLNGTSMRPLKEDDRLSNIAEILEIARYAEGHKICLDLYSHKTNVAAVLDLDTLKPTYIMI